jgi:isopentenyl-diphosphate delta-isomerase
MDQFHDNRLTTASFAADPVFTADQDSLILVDEADRGVGHLSKVLCHEGRGILHRAFSLLIFNDSGELLIQQRSASKRLWPLYWSNSCCSHPRRAETMEAAVQRRLYEELGLRCPLHFLFKFQYQAQFDATGAENELCSVFIGRSTGPVKINSEEILASRWVAPEALQQELTAGAGNFTPWFVLEWGRIWRDHRAEVLDLLSGLGSWGPSR